MPILGALGRQISEYNATGFLSGSRFGLSGVSSLFSLLNSAGLTFGFACIPFPRGMESFGVKRELTARAAQEKQRDAADLLSSPQAPQSPGVRYLFKAIVPLF